MGETCGAVTGGLMIIGLKYGTTEPDRENKMRTYEVAAAFVNKFKALNSSRSIACNKLIDFRIDPGRELNQGERATIIEQCPQYVSNAARIIEGILNNYHEKS
jgi:C_GCAxxG_C_C family probable redox protein